MIVIATYYVDFLTAEHQSNTTSYELLYPWNQQQLNMTHLNGCYTLQ